MTKVFTQPLCGLTIMLLLLSFGPLQTQESSDYTVHANIIYRFTKYVNWPQDKKAGDFIIGIVGETPLYDELKTFVLNKSAGTQKIIIKKFRVSAASFNCHILFIAEEESESIKDIFNKTAYAPILLVSESEGMAKKGACINFVIVQDRLKLEINKSNIEHRKLDIATELLSLGKIVK